MRTLPGTMATDLKGSVSSVRLIVNVWYGGLVAFNDVSIKSWSLDWDSTRQIMGQGKFEIIDTDSKMVPWGYDDPLSVGGGTIQVKLVVGSSSVDLAYMPISRSEPKERWVKRTVNGVDTWVPGGHVISVECDDKTLLAEDDEFLVPETPPALATVFSEIPRIMQGDMDVIIDQTLTDRAVPSTVVYKDKRLEALAQLCDAIGAGQRVTGGGQLYIYNPPTTSLYTYAGGYHDANLADASRQTQKQGLYNGVISTNTLKDGTTLQGTAFEAGGALAWGGNHGKLPYRHQANFATDQASITADAQTQLNTLIKARATTLPFTCRFDPAMETGDLITLMLPQVDGSEYPLPVTVQQVSMQGSTGIDAMMACRGSVAYADMQAAAAANRKKGLFR